MPKYHESYETFNQLPAWTRPVWVEDGRRVENNADPYKWSGDNDPPAVGARVKIYMNRFGTGVVTGYLDLTRRRRVVAGARALLEEFCESLAEPRDARR